MKFNLKINGTDSPSAAYVGWTPAECTLEIEDHSGEASIPVTITTGHDDGREGRISLYESNAMSSMPVDKIERDLQSGGKITFYVAGQYPNASVGKQDTFIKVESGDGSVPEVNPKVMVRVRKNANTLTPQEIEDFLTSFVNLNNLPPRETYPNEPYVVQPSKLLYEIVLMHTYDVMYEIHMRKSFHPWHRAYLMHLEREMQEKYPHVTIPYWKFDKAAENVFTPAFVGKTPHVSSGSLLPEFDRSNPLHSYHNNTAWGPMQRAYKEVDPADDRPSSRIFTEKQIIEEASSPTEFVGWSTYEEGRSHNQAHNAFFGLVGDPGRDPVDPLFFMMHSNVDRLWARWQDKHNRFDSAELATYPFPNEYEGKRGQEWADENPDKWEPNLSIFAVDDDDIGNFADDTLWPWNLDNELSRPMRTYFDEEMRLVPQIRIRFPDSATSTYPTSSITVKSTIDYQGRKNNGHHLGFDYDNIPYFDHDRIPTGEIPMPDIESSNKDFLDSNLPTAERLEASNDAFFQNENDQSEALKILSNTAEQLDIRLRSVTLIDETTEEFLDAALKIIADSTEPGELRFRLILKVLTAKRSNRHFPSRKPHSLIFYEDLSGILTRNYGFNRSIFLRRRKIR